MTDAASPSAKPAPSFKPVLTRLPDSRIAWLRQQKKRVYDLADTLTKDDLERMRSRPPAAAE